MMGALGKLILAATLAVTAVAGETVRGTLSQGAGGQAMVKTEAGKLIRLEGDEDTVGVIEDERLAGADIELIGKFLAPDRFRIGPIYKKSMWVWKHGHKHLISFWCEVCAIRTYTPGICACCQEETALELRTERESRQ